MFAGGDAKVTQKKRLGLAIPVSLYTILKNETEYSGQTLNAFILQILWDWARKGGHI